MTDIGQGLGCALFALCLGCVLAGAAIVVLFAWVIPWLWHLLAAHVVIV